MLIMLLQTQQYEILVHKNKPHYPKNDDMYENEHLHASASMFTANSTALTIKYR